MQRVLVAEPIAAEGIHELRGFANIEVVERHGLTPHELSTEIASYAALVVRSQIEVTRKVIEAGIQLRVIGRAGAGIDNIDVDAATERRILVMNTPGANANGPEAASPSPPSAGAPRGAFFSQMASSLCRTTSAAAFILL